MEKRKIFRYLVSMMFSTASLETYLRHCVIQCKFCATRKRLWGNTSPQLVTIINYMNCVIFIFYIYQIHEIVH